MYALIVHRYDPDTVYFIVDDDDNTALFNSRKEVTDFTKDHPLKRVVDFLIYNIEDNSIEQVY